MYATILISADGFWAFLFFFKVYNYSTLFYMLKDAYSHKSIWMHVKSSKLYYKTKPTLGITLQPTAAFDLRCAVYPKPSS